MPDPITAAEVARAIADALEGRFPYAIGGAIALGFYAPPRATIDVDANVFLQVEERFDELLDLLIQAGFLPAESEEGVKLRALEEGQFRGTVNGLRVDIFVSSIPYYGELESRRRRTQLFGRPLWIIGPEDLVILKLMFFRRKDLADVEAVLRDQGSSLDRGYIHERLRELIGAEDERLRTLEEIERDVDAPG